MKVAFVSVLNIEIIHLAGTYIEELLVLKMYEHSSVVFSAIDFMMEQILSLCFGGTIRTGQISFLMDFLILLFFWMFVKVQMRKGNYKA